MSELSENDQKMVLEASGAVLHAVSTLQDLCARLHVVCANMSDRQDAVLMRGFVSLLGAMIAVVGASADLDLSDNPMPVPRRLEALYGAIRNLPHVEELYGQSMLQEGPN